MKPSPVMGALSGQGSSRRSELQSTAQLWCLLLGSERIQHLRSKHTSVRLCPEPRGLRGPVKRLTNSHYRLQLSLLRSHRWVFPGWIQNAGKYGNGRRCILWSQRLEVGAHWSGKGQRAAAISGWGWTCSWSSSPHPSTTCPLWGGGGKAPFSLYLFAR